MFTFYFFCAVGNGGIRCFFLAVFEVDEYSEKKPLNRCIFFLPLAGGDLAVKVGGVFFRLQADPRGFGLEVADACFSYLEHP